MQNNFDTSLLISSSRAAGFDNTLTVSDGVKFLADPLDEVYLVRPPTSGLIPRGMLPPEDLEVRAYLIEALTTQKEIESFGFFKKIFNPSEFANVEERYEAKLVQLSTIVAKSPEHKAAFKRILHSNKGDDHKLLGVLTNFKSS